MERLKKRETAKAVSSVANEQEGIAKLSESKRRLLPSVSPEVGDKSTTTTTPVKDDNLPAADIPMERIERIVRIFGSFDERTNQQIEDWEKFYKEKKKNPSINILDSESYWKIEPKWCFFWGHDTCLFECE